MDFVQHGYGPIVRLIRTRSLHLLRRRPEIEPDGIHFGPWERWFRSVRIRFDFFCPAGKSRYATFVKSNDKNVELNEDEGCGIFAGRVDSVTRIGSSPPVNIC